MLYDTWRVAEFEASVLRDFDGGGRHPLAARLLAARGFQTSAEAERALDAAILHDPFSLPDMDKAVERIGRAIASGEHMAVYGDFDADGVTATALLVRALRARGARCDFYIPDRVEEGYGLHEAALRHLAGQGVTLVVTVDTGVTALDEARVARELGMDLIITDHHECRETLPDAVAVINPRRKDSKYPFAGLAGVGVAFKLVCALEGESRLPLYQYGDLAALGTVADVMPVLGENRALITHGLRRMAQTDNPGLRALLDELEVKKISAVTVGFTIAPRINAAGRVGQAGTALELFLTEDSARAQALARQLGVLNTQRQSLENFILEQAQSGIDPDAPALVLSGEGWHSGVAGIVAARLSAKYDRPVFLICIEGGEGRGSARGSRGPGLVELLAGQSELLSDYGGHERAAGFSLPRANIETFRQAVCNHYAALPRDAGSVLDVDGVLRPEWLDLPGLRALETLEPFGAGFAGPVFCIKDAALTGVTPLGGGKHMRIGLECGGYALSAVWFGQAPPLPDMGAFIDVAFKPEINRFRGQDSVQLQVVDIRPSESGAAFEARQRALYDRFEEGGALSPEEALSLRPDREDMVSLWRALGRCGAETVSHRLLAGRVTASGRPGGAGKLRVALDVLCEMGLVALRPVLSSAETGKRFSGASKPQWNEAFACELRADGPRADLTRSDILRRLRAMSEGGVKDERA